MSESDAVLIAFALGGLPDFMRAPESPPGSQCLRVSARALSGMQKEAFVSRAPAAAAWRLLCDEGPYLDGTDLAPPPLAYFAAGMASHDAALILDEAKRSGIDLGDWSLRLDTHYSMEGSALKGTMTGGARPAELRLRSDAVGEAQLRELVAGALRRSVAEAVMATAFSGDFSIHHNGAAITTARVKATGDAAPTFEEGEFDSAARSKAHGSDPAIIRKLAPVAPSTDPTHGQGASLKESQKRLLHLNAELRPRRDGLLRGEVHLIRPLGSTFRFLAANSENTPTATRAPGGLDYLAAGLALCFLTQMGRYAKITKGHLAAYSVVQDLMADREPPRVRALTTHARVASEESADTVRQFVDMSEQTCFLHASCRSSNPTQINNG